MRREITIGDMPVEMVANAATPFVFKKIFGLDLLRKMQNDPEDVNQYFELAFTMAQQAAHPGLELLDGKVGKEDFIVWLENFEMVDILEATSDILDLYQASRKGTSIPKNQAD